MAERRPRHLCLLGDASSVHLQRWAHEMLARGWRVSVLTARPAALDGVEQLQLPPVARPADWLWRVGAARRALDRLAPDLVHAHYVSSYGYLAARCGRRPLVMTAWGSDLLVTPRRSRAMRWLTGWTLSRADLITGDSADLVQAARDYRPRAALHRVHWGADTMVFRPVPWQHKTGFQIASLRAWDSNYHIHTLVDALALLRRSHPAAPLQLHLLGGGPLEAALREQVHRLGLDGLVVWHGRVGDAAMVEALSRCKVSVSVPASDATSVAMLESMACALPVVASDLPANREWLDGAPLVPAGDAAALAHALASLLDDDGLAQRLGQANLERIRRDGARAAQMDRMSALYEGLLASPRELPR